MKQKDNSHSVQSFSLILLFFLFVLLMLMTLIASASVYQSSVRKQDVNNQLFTASNYLTTRFRQHSDPELISTVELQGLEALCFTDTMNGTVYHTFLYLQGGELKELFTAENSAASPDMGTVIARLDDFSFTEEDGQYTFLLKDEDGNEVHTVLHAGPPVV